VKKKYVSGTKNEPGMKSDAAKARADANIGDARGGGGRRCRNKRGKRKHALQATEP
jgi:hypothetical protein